MKIELNPIGIIHSPFSVTSGMPVQPAGASHITGAVEIFEEFAEGLQDLEGFSHIILIYHFHKINSFRLKVIPFMDSVDLGLFATRAPSRPNPLGLSVKLEKVEDNILHIRNVDILDGTPLLDINPYVPEFDNQKEIKTGWLEKAHITVQNKKSDNRFK